MRAALLMFALAGCVPAERPVPEYGAGSCDAAAGQALVGRVADEVLVTEAKRLTRSKVARVITPGSAVTMDYRTDRVNLGVDAKRVLIKVGCG